MKKRFVTRRRGYFSLIKIIIYIIIIYLTCFLTVKLLFKAKIKIDDEKRINQYLAVASNNIIGDISIIDLINMNLVSPETFLTLSLNSFRKLEYNPVKKEDALKVIKEVKKPTIYIYNTHQSEDYDPGNLKEYNITPTVYMASVMLQKELEKKGIYSIVEDADIKTILNINNWTYIDSYRASRLLLDEVVLKYPTIKYFIDVHRDSVTGRVEINNESYAKLMFVIGLDHKNYEKNEALMTKMFNYIDENYPNVVKNNFYRENGRFNQDFSPKTILVEVGGVKNTIDEVYNSTTILAEAIEKVIGDESG